MTSIRNFSIIAHIDHGKSTLADRMLELTETVNKRKMKEQLLDQMELERERGITIKLQPVRMKYKNSIFNLIDTPGHVDFSYEVSRSLAAVEGTLLVIDATQGIQAQTLANLYLALDQDLEIIPVLNKIDLPAARVEQVSDEVVDLLGCNKDDIILVSAKTGEGVANLLEIINQKIPAPKPKREDDVLQALIFDSKYDDYQGVVAYIKIVSGQISLGDKLHFIGTQVDGAVTDVGYFSPQTVKADKLETGQIGYVVTGLKDIDYCRVGDTIVNYKLSVANKKDKNDYYKELALSGYKDVQPMVFAGIFCKEGSDYEDLRDALAKLRLTDASLSYEPESSIALGFGFRCGFLGMLHMEIITERIKREYGIDLIVTVPSVAYKIKKHGSHEFKEIHSAHELPNQGEIEKVQEPWVKCDILTPKEHIGDIMELVQAKRGVYKNTEYFSQETAILHYELPLSSILVDFYDKLKSATKGYATLNYTFVGYLEANIVRIDILVAEEMVEALSTVAYSDEAHRAGKQIVYKLKDILPRQMFEVKIQAAINYQADGKNKGGKIIASAKIPPMRKDVTAKLYGGDVTRKRKLLEKQKKGKKKMKGMGKVDIPPEAYLSILKR